MEFSFVTLTLIDISVLSICLITLWWLKKQVDRYKVLSEETREQYNTILGQHNTLQEAHGNLLTQHDALLEEFRVFQSASDRRYNTLQQEYNTMKEENATLRAGLDALTREHKALQTAHDRLSGRHAELVERVIPVFEILAREKLMEINARNEN